MCHYAGRWRKIRRPRGRLFGRVGRIACASYGVQILGCLALLLAAGHSVPLLLLGVLLFGAGIGNATSLPPLIAQVEFAPEDTARVVPSIVAIAQASYAFAPATFGLVRELGPAATSAGAAPWLFAAAAAIQALAVAAFLLRRRPIAPNDLARKSMYL